MQKLRPHTSSTCGIAVEFEIVRECFSARHSIPRLWCNVMQLRYYSVLHTALSWCSAIMYFNMPKTFKRRIDSNSTVPICIYRLYRCLVDSDVLILVAQRCLRSSLYSITFSMGLFRIMELSLRARFTHDLC